jgi:hypothetical protein
MDSWLVSNLTGDEGDDQITLWLTGFLDFIHRLVFLRTQRFGNLICFRPQMKVWEAPTFSGPLVFFGISDDGQSPKTQ